MNNIPSKFLALSPLDGRYFEVGETLSPYFSEYALVKNRVWVEINWLVFLLENIKDSKILNTFPKDKIDDIKKIYNDFSSQSFSKIKEIESVTNHDVKAIEYFIDEELKNNDMSELISYVHIGCTSEDINNTAYANMIKNSLNDVWIPMAEELISLLDDFSKEYMDLPMLAHTHGQPATPTTVGKEFAVYVYRLKNSLENLKRIKTTAKFNGATGNYSALSIAFPNENWPALAKKFVENYLHLTFNPITTQIEGHDYMCHIFDAIRHFNNIVLDLDRDMWLYISYEYFGQKVIKNEVGSSTMPHKVNPIKFENSESNIDTSNALLVALSNKLPCSRLQRDLSDSSSQRNIGIAFGYSLQAITQTISGLKRIKVNSDIITSELETNWEVLAEPIQTVLRKYGIPDAYDKLKQLTRGKSISKDDIHSFINSLDIISPEDKKNLLNLTPKTYIGYANKFLEV